MVVAVIVGVAVAVVVPVIVFAVAVVVIAVAVIVMVVAVVVVALFGGHLVAFKQAHAQQQWQAHIPFHRAQDARVGFDLPQPAFHLGQALLTHEVAFVEQQDVAVHHLRAGDLAIEDLVAEVLGVDQGDDRIEPGGVAQIATQERHGHR